MPPAADPPDDATDDAPRTPRRPRRPPAPASNPAPSGEQPYTRYRARRKLLYDRRDETQQAQTSARSPEARVDPDQPARPGRPGRRRRLRRLRRPRARTGLRWLTRARLIFSLLTLVVGWLLLSLVLFLVSAQFNRSSPPSNVKTELDAGGFPLTSTNNVLVLGSDQRTAGSREPGASSSGPSRSDVIMLVRAGGGHAARLSIPRDTIVEIPGHGQQKINAAYAFGGPALSIAVVKRYLGIPINHLVEVNFANFPHLIDAMGGVDYTGGCVVSRINGGFRNGGYTLRLRRGTNHLDGKQALALARTRKNLCKPSENDLDRAKRQQALLQDMKSRLLSISSFVRLPWISWNAPPAIISDMSGASLLGLFGALSSSGSPPTEILRPTGFLTLPDGEAGLTVSQAAKQAAVRRFLNG
ncbi:MAG TPA: LCP family protein [Solirubrobacteraceae bacterium]|nr:LCP family protein [Solirubrobacteraceae bacterium]